MQMFRSGLGTEFRGAGIMNHSGNHAQPVDRRRPLGSRTGTRPCAGRRRTPWKESVPSSRRKGPTVVPADTVPIAGELFQATSPSYLARCRICQDILSGTFSIRRSILYNMKQLASSFCFPEFCLTPFQERYGR